MMDGILIGRLVMIHFLVPTFSAIIQLWADDGSNERLIVPAQVCENRYLAGVTVPPYMRV